MVPSRRPLLSRPRSSLSQAWMTVSWASYIRTEVMGAGSNVQRVNAVVMVSVEGMVNVLPLLIDAMMSM